MATPWTPRGRALSRISSPILALTPALQPSHWPRQGSGLRSQQALHNALHSSYRGGQIHQRRTRRNFRLIPRRTGEQAVIARVVLVCWQPRCIGRVDRPGLAPTGQSTSPRPECIRPDVSRVDHERINQSPPLERKEIINAISDTNTWLRMHKLKMPASGEVSECLNQHLPSASRAFLHAEWILERCCGVRVRVSELSSPAILMHSRRLPTAGRANERRDQLPPIIRRLPFPSGASARQHPSGLQSSHAEVLADGSYWCLLAAFGYVFFFSFSFSTRAFPTSPHGDRSSRRCPNCLQELQSKD